MSTYRSFVVVIILQVTLYHLLKLFQTESALASGKKQLVSEFYDEVVSTNLSHSICHSFKEWLLLPRKGVSVFLSKISFAENDNIRLNPNLKLSQMLFSYFCYLKFTVK